MTYPRVLDMARLVKRKSFFLFGPRSTGKTTLLRQQFSPDVIINLLRSSEYLPLAENPSFLAERVAHIRQMSEVVVIDEIQKLPVLLDEVHNLIEQEGITFVLTGSSGRKLKRGGVNLLAGRAWRSELFPLTTTEIPGFDIDRYVLYGGLPQVYNSEFPAEELDAYVNTYLQEEIREEALVQNVAYFTRFLKTAAFVNTEQINYANIAGDTGIPASSVRAWFEILVDTFLGFIVQPWQGSQKRKAVATAKFYFFDVGVANFVRGISVLERQSTDFGKAFEHFIAMELRSYISYRRVKTELMFWRTHTGVEVDFLVGEDLAVEVKSAFRVTRRMQSGLRALREDLPEVTAVLVSFDENDRVSPEGFRILHWRTFVKVLWDDGFNIGTP